MSLGILPIIGTFLKKTVQIALNVGGLVKSLFANNDGFNLKSFSNKNRDDINEVANLNAALTDYRTQVGEVGQVIENDIINSCEVFFDDLIGLFESINNSYSIGNIERARRKTSRFRSHIEGTFENHTAKRVSLDDMECLEILKMLPGETKSIRMSELKKKVFEESVEKIAYSIKDITEELIEDISDSFNFKLNMLEQQLNEKMNIFSVLTNNTNSREELEESIGIYSNYLLSVSNIIENLQGVE